LGQNTNLNKYNFNFNDCVAFLRRNITHFDCFMAVVVTGLACKDPKNVQASHFSFSGLHLAGNTSNGGVQIPGLNTLGISAARIDYAPYGINPPHTHPRASEILTVLEGSLEVGFVTSNPGNRLITKVLQKRDIFVFPINLVHFQRKVGKSNAVALAALSSQNAGVITIANAVLSLMIFLQRLSSWTRM